jgi:hypothetical protein
MMKAKISKNTALKRGYVAVEASVKTVNSQ